MAKQPQSIVSGAVTPSNSLQLGNAALPHGRKPAPGYLLTATQIAQGQFAGAYEEYVSGARQGAIEAPFMHIILPTQGN